MASDFKNGKKISTGLSIGSLQGVVRLGGVYRPAVILGSNGNAISLCRSYIAIC